MKTLAFCILFILQGCASLPKAVTPGAVVGDGSETIYVSNHGSHTGVIVDAGPVFKAIPELKERFPESRYLEFGWGDADFYQADEKNSGLTIQAILLPTDSVVHVVGFSGKPKRFFAGSDVRPLNIAASGVSSLVEFIANSFEKSGTGGLIDLKPGYYANSQFYAGAGSYHAFNTCNTWTAKAVNSSGIEINTAFKLTAASVMTALDRIDR